jgi:hypothetical protein
LLLARPEGQRSGSRNVSNSHHSSPSYHIGTLASDPEALRGSFEFYRAIDASIRPEGEPNV